MEISTKKWAVYVLFTISALSLLTPFWVFKDILFPYVTSKAFYFRICVELGLPFYLYLVLTNKKLRPKLNLPNIAVLLFLLINIVSAFTGVNVARSLWGNFERMGGVYYLAHLVALYFYAQALGQAGSIYLKRFLQCLVGVAVIVTLNGLSGWLGGPVLIQDPSLPVRVSSTFGNPIFFPSFLIVPMFLSLYFAMQEEHKAWKVAYFVAAALQLLGIYTSGTRGAVVGLILGLFVAGVIYIVLVKKPKIKKYGLLGVGAFLLLAILIFVNHDKLKPGSTLYRIANLRDSNTEARLIQWKVALKGFKDHPILGVGSENYYVISDTYYDPAIYQYDPSWFDKPHNFLLEVLATNGILGFVVYLSMFLFALWALYKAFKAGLISLLEMCLLAAAIITYQVQNLFVFDTVSASVAFYVFMGLAAYLWSASSKHNESKLDEVPVVGPGFAAAALGVSMCLALYLVYASNIISMQASKRVNYGFAYTDYDPQKAAGFFESAMALGFNLDPRESVNRYSDFTHRLLTMDNKNLKLDFVTAQIDKSTAIQRAITEKTGNDPLLWMRLTLDEMDKAIVHNQSMDAAKLASEKAIAIAPKRAELIQLKIQIAGYTKDWETAVNSSEESVKLNPFSSQLRWQLAIAYYLAGRMEDAVIAGDKAMAMGFQFSALQQFAWYISYYQGKQNWARVVPLLEQAVSLQTNDIGLYIDLAKAYAGIGDKQHAEAIAKQVMQSDPSKKGEMEAFIASLK